MLTDAYKPIYTTRLATAKCFIADTTEPVVLSLSSPAVEAMTDLRATPAVVIGPDAALADANQRMINRGVRLLFVTDEDSHVVGIITATDLLGERPITTANSRGITISDLMVYDIMTTSENIEVISMHDVRRAEIGHVIATLSKHKRQHALVMERDDTGKSVVRGIFSASTIARNMAKEINSQSAGSRFLEIGENHVRL